MFSDRVLKRFAGWQGWGMASVPALKPVLYQPAKRAGKRFSVMDGTLTPRVYHSTANLLTVSQLVITDNATL